MIDLWGANSKRDKRLVCPTCLFFFWSFSSFFLRNRAENISDWESFFCAFIEQPLIFFHQHYIISWFEKRCRKNKVKVPFFFFEKLHCFIGLQSWSNINRGSWTIAVSWLFQLLDSFHNTFAIYSCCFKFVMWKREGAKVKALPYG